MVVEVVDTSFGIAPNTCYAQPFDTVIHSDFLNNNLPDKCTNLIKITKA
jgi:hypothetical protein